jgi:CheY-like chemotaxis protein
VNRNILVIDDQPDIVLMVRLILELEGDQVLGAGSGEEGLEVLARTEPDAVLLDIRLPGVDGWGVLRELRDSHRLERLPVVMISAHSAPSAARRALEEGARGYLTKPFDVDDLLHKLDEVAGAPRLGDSPAPSAGSRGSMEPRRG